MPSKLCPGLSFRRAVLDATNPVGLERASARSASNTGMTGVSVSFPSSPLGISLLPKLSVEQDEEWVEVEEWSIA